ncbi:MAG: hypothetical protein K2I08_00840 [Muribaculaceae bacterium]|nr:hypothetical protein [Muribaculaceae bacterium]
MIRIGRFEFGFAPLSMVILFIVLSIFAISSALSQARPEWSMPVSGLIIINESVALVATLVYGILVHLIMTFMSWIKQLKD